MIISAVLMNMSYSINSRFRVEAQARKMGMIYPSEARAMDLKDGE